MTTTTGGRRLALAFLVAALALVVLTLAANPESGMLQARPPGLAPSA